MENRLDKDIEISARLFEMAKECEENGMEVEDIFLSSIAVFFALGEPGLNRALLILGERMTTLADSYGRVVKALKVFEDVIRKEKNAKNN